MKTELQHYFLARSSVFLRCCLSTSIEDQRKNNKGRLKKIMKGETEDLKTALEKIGQLQFQSRA